jgi:UDP-N-acetylglucosamine 2-epimerase (non-hydrolysing)
VGGRRLARAGAISGEVSALNPLIVMGTRPEAIKLAPVAKAISLGNKGFRICVTAQHRALLDQVLEVFDIKPDYDLDIMRPGQNLHDLTAAVISNMRDVLRVDRPSVLVVQGDTTTVLGASLAAFYERIPVAHVEAGLRTGSKWAPFPEEMNRILTSDLADFHFAPTETAKRRLVAEGKRADRIWVTGNTVVDALKEVSSYVRDLARPPGVPRAVADDLVAWFASGERTILVTGHRRESFGKGFEEMAKALLRIVKDNPESRVVYAVHPNPNVRGPITERLAGVPRIHLLDPLPYAAFVWAMTRSYLLLTDSGGIQEEGPAIGKPVLVMRDTTERPEGVEAGTSRLVGTDADRIVEGVERILLNDAEYRSMTNRPNPYGDGTASARIVEVLRNHGLA